MNIEGRQDSEVPYWTICDRGIDPFPVSVSRAALLGFDNPHNFEDCVC